MNTKPQPAPPPKFKKPAIGASVHYFDQTRDMPFSNPGKGPYAAMVVMIAPKGPQLKVFAPHGVFDVEAVPHRTELDAKEPTRKKWWQWPRESVATDDVGKAEAAREGR